MAATFGEMAWVRAARSRSGSIYSIKPGYRHASKAEPFDDRSNTDEWQREVYELAGELMNANGLTKVIDVGCGSGYKLVHLLGQFNTVGIEIDPAFDFLRQKYPSRQWLNFNEVNPEELTADLVICSDVIEHIADPDELLSFLARIHSKQFLISTPERDAVAGVKHSGPPRNPAHYREWNQSEFYNYLSSRFNIIEQRVFPGRSVTQVLICKQHNL